MNKYYTYTYSKSNFIWCARISLHDKLDFSNLFSKFQKYITFLFINADDFPNIQLSFAKESLKFNLTN